MTLELLDTYLDASGKRSNAKDRLITVNGCLSTPAKWQEFDNEWQATLKGFGFKPHPKSGRYVFHTTDFHSGFCKLSPAGLSKARKQVIYRKLIQIVKNHSLFLFGFAVALKDFSKFETEFPFISKYRFGKPGTFISILGVGKCIEWAGQNGYSQSISLMFDQGDEFWGEMSHGYRDFVRNWEYEHLKADSLTCGDKAVFSPLQAADIVAWECRKFFTQHLNALVTGQVIRPQRELEMLGNSRYFTLFQYDDLKRRVSEIFPDKNGGIAEIEQGLRREIEEHAEKLRLKRERRKARKSTTKAL
ncbi:MAG TPA: DUF3800 domain-containing protein [Pyrinomonadaceae bacterium]|jgi:hypothetical protein